MTFLPGQVISTEQWRERHRGHKLRKIVERVSIKAMYWLVCDQCGERHLYKMKTIGEKQ